jgi:hypothetical protein
VPELKAQGEDERKPQFDRRLAIIQALNVGRFVVEIDGDGQIVPRPFGCFAHVSPPDHQVSEADETRWRQHVEISRPS